MKITLYELFTLCDITETDIADNTYDFMVNFSCHLKKGQCHDNYALLMRRFATLIDCTAFDIESPTLAHCDIVKFIKDNIEIFDEFMLKHNKEEFQPSPLIEDESEVWYDVYMGTFENLVIGNYSDEACGELNKKLSGSVL